MPAEPHVPLPRAWWVGRVQEYGDALCGVYAYSCTFVRVRLEIVFDSGGRAGSAANSVLRQPNLHARARRRQRHFGRVVKASAC